MGWWWRSWEGKCEWGTYAYRIVDVAEREVSCDAFSKGREVVVVEHNVVWGGGGHCCLCGASIAAPHVYACRR